MSGEVLGVAEMPRELWVFAIVFSSASVDFLSQAN
jgi:hypothetical protein